LKTDTLHTTKDAFVSACPGKIRESRKNSNTVSRYFFLAILYTPKTDTTTMLGSGSLFIVILHSYTYNNTILFYNSITIDNHSGPNPVKVWEVKSECELGWRM